MFGGLLLKEIKYQLKSITIYLFLAVMIIFYITQFSPPSLNKPLEPMDEMHFTYWKLIEDYHDGKLIDKDKNDMLNLLAANRILSEEEEKMRLASNLTLSLEQKDILKNIIKKINPMWSDQKEDITKLNFAVGYNEFKIIMAKLDAGLGGMTYYCDSFRSFILLRENSYGVAPITDLKEKMKCFYEKMNMDLSKGKVLKLTFGFGKYINLNQQQINIISTTKDSINPSILEKIDIDSLQKSYTTCISRMNAIDTQLGRGTSYGDSYREISLFRSKTYQEAKSDFNLILQNDKLTGAYGRYFADYMGIVAGFFPVFIAAFVFTRDRKYGMNEIINCKPVSSLSYITAKYLAVTVVTFTCLFLVATHATAAFIQISQFYSYQIDYLAFYKYTLVGILPTILFTNALSILLSVVFDNGIIAILVQLIVWFSSLNPTFEDYSLLKPIIRFNTIGSHDFYVNHLHSIISNRVFFVFISAVILLLTSIFWAKRRGNSYEGIRLRKTNNL